MKKPSEQVMTFPANDTDKPGCRMVAEALMAYGVKHVVVSPGSRNAPLIMAVVRRDMQVHPVIDERSAAFVALGMATALAEPVALICTSGTALLNYAPAVAEAFYRHVPLIVVSADRPEAWIDQNDSQTIRQPGALANIVRSMATVRGEMSDADERWMANRKLNDILTAALTAPRGPVHINVPLSMPLTNVTASAPEPLFRKIGVLAPDGRLATDEARRLAALCSGRRVLVVAAQSAPDSRINGAMAAMAALPGVAVIAEPLSNVRVRGVMGECDALLSAPLSDEEVERLNPDILIAFGGAPVSAALKQFVRRLHPAEGWYVGRTDAAIDTYRSLTMRVEIEPPLFFPRFSASMRYLGSKAAKVEGGESYADLWRRFAAMRLQPLGKLADRLTAEGCWCAPLAVREIIDGMRGRAAGINLQLGNGMSVRYAQAFGAEAFHRVDGNRGVSGIDGSVSTAVGASAVSSLPTLLIVGDMSMQYDLGALASTLIGGRLSMVVLNNGGGGIFHFVKTTRSLPERDDYFTGNVRLPLREIAGAYGFRYMRADSFDSLAEGVRELCRPEQAEGAPLILEVVTDGSADAAVFSQLIGSESFADTKS